MTVTEDMLRTLLWPSLLGPVPMAGRPCFVSCQIPTGSDDSLTLSAMRAMLEEMLCCYSTAEETDAVTLGLLGTRLDSLAISRVRVGSSGVAGGGLGVFATRTLEEGEIFTLYPGDALLHFADGTTDAAGVLTADEVKVSFGQHVGAERRRAQTQSIDTLTVARAYELPATSMMSLLGDPTLVDDLAYVGHMVNDCAACRATSGLGAYAIATATHVNAAHMPLLGCHFASVTTRRVEAGDELFVSYGPGYWLSRQGVSAQEIREAEEALGVEIRSGGALCEALQAALEAQPAERAAEAEAAATAEPGAKAAKRARKEAKRACKAEEEAKNAAATVAAGAATLERKRKAREDRRAAKKAAKTAQ